jgi:hypothetical protein
MVYREPNLDTCASAAPARVARSVGVFVPTYRICAGSLGVASIQTSYLRTNFRRRHPLEQRTRNATPLPPSQGLWRDRPPRLRDPFHQSPFDALYARSGQAFQLPDAPPLTRRGSFPFAKGAEERIRVFVAEQASDFRELECGL